jgi:hypothetical protein
MRRVHRMPRREDAERARGLLRVDPGREMMRCGAGLQLAQGFGVDAGVPHVQFEDKIVPQGVGSFHHNIKGLDAVNGDVALGENLGLGMVEIDADENAELIGQGQEPSLGDCDAAAGVAATLRLVAAFQPPHSG